MEREGAPPKDVDRSSAALRAVEEEADRASALLPTVPLLTSPPTSIPEVDSESQHSLRGALQSEIAASPGSSSISSPFSTNRIYGEVSSLQRTLAVEAKKQDNHLRVNSGWRTNSKTRNKIHLESELKERH